MGSRLFDYESDLLHVGLPQEAHSRHPRKSPESPAHSRTGSTSAPTSTSTTRSSVSEASSVPGLKVAAMPTSAAPLLPVSRHQKANSVNHISPFKQKTGSSGSLHEQYKAASQGDPMVPTNEIQEWAHQVHVTQRREYNWCTYCCPRKMEPLQIPSEKVMKRVRIQEPSHAYE